MKSNSVHIKNSCKWLLMAACVSVMATPIASAAQDDNDGPGEALSNVGVETGLELYDKDKDDYCVDTALQIRATFHNVTAGGILKAELFGEQDFMKSKGKLRRIRVPAKDGKVRICINLPAPGQFAVVGYNDLDADRRLKKAWNFKPKEPYGLSNNPEIRSLRLPKWSETRFNVPMDGADIDIYLIDPDAED